MSDIRSWVARNIAQGTRRNNTPLRRLPALQKKFKFGDTWITLNRTIGEALMLETHSSEKRSKRGIKRIKPPSRICRRRRNATTVVDLTTRLMTNGQTWPTRNDWLIGRDKKVHYAPSLRHLRRLESTEWFGSSRRNSSEDETSKELVRVTEAITVTQPRGAEESTSTDEREGTKKIIFGSAGLGAIELSKVLATEDGASVPTLVVDQTAVTTTTTTTTTLNEESASDQDFRSMSEPDVKSTSDPEFISMSERDSETDTVSDDDVEERTSDGRNEADVSFDEQLLADKIGSLVRRSRHSLSKSTDHADS